MNPGFYVVRLPKKNSATRRKDSLIVESRPFKEPTYAHNWRAYIKGLFPKDEVFVIEIKEHSEAFV